MAATLALIPTLALAETAYQFPQDLHLGMLENNDVKLLQTVMKSQGVFTGSASGNFLSLIRNCFICIHTPATS